MFKLLAVVICALPALADEPRWTNSRQVVLSCDAQGEVEKAALWTSPDNGRHWTPAPHRLEGSRIHTEAPSDGRWSFFIVLENGAGTSAQPPGEGTPPHATVIVDCAAPTLQILGARCVPSAGLDDRAQVLLRTVLADENLGPRAIRAFYRTVGSDQWLDGGTINYTHTGDERELCWSVPADAHDRLQLMIVVTDRAGNRSSDTTDPITVPPSTAPARPTSPPAAASQPTSAPAIAADDVSAKERSAGDPTGPPDIAALHRADVLRRRGKQHLLAGDLGLALARFEEAVAADPTDAATLTDLGAALLRANRLDDARTRFDAALKFSQRNIDALDGLAEIAVGQQRFSDGRDLLHRIVEQSPDSTHTWLRLGDVEFKLGRRSEAIAAWQKAATSGKGTDAGEKAATRLKTFTERPAN